MLHLERCELSLESARLRTSLDLLVQLFDLAPELAFLRVVLRRAQHPGKAQAGSIRRRLEPSFAIILLPLRKHERMDIQRMGNVLRLDLRVIRQLYSLNLELVAVAFDLLRTDRRRHLNPLER